MYTIYADDYIKKLWNNAKSTYVQNFRSNHGVSTNYRKFQMSFLDPHIPLSLEDRVKVVGQKVQRIKNDLAILADQFENNENKENSPQQSSPNKK